MSQNDMVDNDNPSSSHGYTLQWLKGDACRVETSQAADFENEQAQSFACRLYRLCLHTLREVSRTRQGERLSTDGSSPWRECLERFYLWGEDFGDGDLDRALDRSDELRDVVLERLAQIGTLLLSGKPIEMA